MEVKDRKDSGLRVLSDHEVSLVSGSLKEVSYVDAEGSLVTERWSNDGTTFYGLSVDYNYDGGTTEIDWGWAAAGAIGGIYVGSEFAGVAAVGISLGVEYGVIGASAGAALGPVGLVAGAVIGVAAGYVIYEYGPEIWETTWGNQQEQETTTNN